MIEINNILRRDLLTNIMKDYEFVIKIIKNESPRSQLFIQSILPTNGRGFEVNNDVVVINHYLNDLVAKYGLNYIDLVSLFLDKKSVPKTQYSLARLHLIGSGYILWKNYFKKLIIE